MAKIAWIEDNPELLDAFVKALKRANHEIVSYDSWQVAEDNLEEIRKSDLVLLDIILPPENKSYAGISILRKLREDLSYQCPVIVFTSVQNPVILHELQELKPEEILRRPTPPSRLVEAVTRALAKKDTRIQNHLTRE
jgi:CheY-like chemotaxis protein